MPWTVVVLCPKVQQLGIHIHFSSQSNAWYIESRISSCPAMALASAHRKLLINISYLYWEFNWEPNQDAPWAVLFHFLMLYIYIWYNLLPSLSHLVTNRNHVWVVFKRLWHVTLSELTVADDWEMKCTSVNFLHNEGFYCGPSALTHILCCKSIGIQSFKWKYLSNQNLLLQCLHGYMGSLWSSCSWKTLYIHGISKFLSHFHSFYYVFTME